MPNVDLVDATCCAELRHLAFHDIRRINNGIRILETSGPVGAGLRRALAHNRWAHPLGAEIAQFEKL
jgi:hypothetical protein